MQYLSHTINRTNSTCHHCGYIITADLIELVTLHNLVYSFASTIFDSGKCLTCRVYIIVVENLKGLFQFIDF